MNNFHQEYCAGSLPLDFESFAEFDLDARTAIAHHLDYRTEWEVLPRQDAERIVSVFCEHYQNESDPQVRHNMLGTISWLTIDHKGLQAKWDSLLLIPVEEGDIDFFIDVFETTSDLNVIPSLVNLVESRPEPIKSTAAKAIEQILERVESKPKE